MVKPNPPLASPATERDSPSGALGNASGTAGRLDGAAWLASIMAIAILGGTGSSLPELSARTIFCHYPLEALLFYLSTAAICSGFSGRNEFFRRWLLVPLLAGALSTLFFHPLQPMVAWVAQWGLGGAMVLIRLRHAGPARRLVAGLAVTAAGGLFWRVFGLTPPGGPDARAELGQEPACLLFVVVCGLSVLALYLHDRRQCGVVLRNFRWERILHYLGMLALGLYMSASGLPPASVLLAAALAVGLAWGSAVANNDLVDVEIDRWSNPDRPLVAGSWSPRSFALLAVFQGALAVGGAYCVNEAFAVCILVFLAVAFIYSTPPLRLKKYLGLSTGLIAFASLIVAVAGFVCSGERSLAQFPVPVAWYCMIALTCGVNFKDIKDYEGDRREGIQTAVTVLGLRAGKLLAATLVSVGFLSAPWIFRRADLWLPSVVFSVVAGIVITRHQFREKLLFLIYYGYFLVLIAAGLFRG